jgi:small redox-active disulfide protein 2
VLLSCSASEWGIGAGDNRLPLIFCPITINMHSGGAMKKIQILASGPDLDQFVQNVQAATRDLRSDYEIETISDMNEILKFGVMYTPALVIDGEVKLVGKIPEVDEIQQYLKK